MPFISLDSVKLIWRQTLGSRWYDLERVLEHQYYEEGDELDEHMAVRMIKAVEKMEDWKVPFPQTYYQLYELLNQWA
jgi:hypothetical protein